MTCPHCGADLIPGSGGGSFYCPKCASHFVRRVPSEQESEVEDATFLYDQDTMHAMRDKAKHDRDAKRAERDAARFRRDEKRAERDMAYAPVNAKIKEAELNAELERNRRVYKLILILLFVPLLLIVLMNLSSALHDSLAPLFGEGAVPVSSDEAVGLAYSDLRHRFEDAGFTNISCQELEDLNLGMAFFYDEGMVDHVTVNGDSEFESGAYYSLDVPIRIHCHSYPE